MTINTAQTHTRPLLPDGQLHTALRLTGLLLTILFPTILLIPLQPSPAMAAESRAAEDRLPEEITITGPRMFRRVEQDIRDAEDAMYALFNELNEDDQYDIHCAWRKRIGSRTRVRECLPAVFNDAMRALAVNEVSDVEVAQPPAMSVLARHSTILEQKMRALIQQSPALLTAVQEHHQLREELAAMKATYFGEDASADD